MKPFLHQVAETFYRNEGDNLQHIAFVFPNRRSGRFFQSYLTEFTGEKPQFSPRIVTINTLVTELSRLQPVDKIELLFLLYEEYIALRQTDESFDHFVFWGEMLIADFDDVDKYMVDAHKLFANIKDLKDLEQLYLEPEQIAIIKKFWDTFFVPDTDSAKKVEFNSLWSIMYALYTHLRERLSSQGVGYEGMLFRQVAEAAMRGELPPLHTLHATSHCSKVVFVGFNAITEAERIIMDYFKKNVDSDFYWDYYAPTLQHDDENRANYFIQRNIKQFPSKYELIDGHTITSAPTLTVLPVSSAIGQVKQAGEILQTLIDEGAVNRHNAINTAVVLPDEELLMPMIYSIPSAIDDINITMGYSLRNTSVASLLDTVFKLQRRVRWSGGKALYYHIEVAAVLNHRLVRMLVENEKVDAIIAAMNRKNMAYVSADFLANEQHPLLQLIFTPITQDADASNYVEDIVQYLVGATYDERVDKQDDVPVNVRNLEHEYAYHYGNMVSRLNDVIEEHAIVSMTANTYFTLLGKLSLSIPFEGEPLSGLQVMGVLETRALDFDNIIILSMNEGVFPAKSITSGFIPYNLRRGFNMATTEHQDSIYAYYFYRMIGRAKRVYMLYDSRTEGLTRGEMSRYIYQLKYHYAHLLPQYKVDEYAVVHGVLVEKPIAISIPKTGGVAMRLRQFLKDGASETRPLSASSIKTYINCPLQFYLQHVERMRTDDEISEFVDGGVFGSIYHNVMADIYDDMKGTDDAVDVTRAMLDKVIADEAYIKRKIEEQFNIVFYRREKNEPLRKLSGKDHITAHTVYTYVLRTLEYDREKFAPFTYIGSEMRLENELYLPLGSGKQVRFKALIDRVDKMMMTDECGGKQEVIRIIDYKTGSDAVEVGEIAKLFDREEKHGFGAMFQVFLYCKLFHIKYPEVLRDNIPLLPLIYKVRNAFSDFVPLLHVNNLPVESYDDVKKEFEPMLEACLEEIFDETVPFEQTQVLEHCQYCDFKTICKRN